MFQLPPVRHPSEYTATERASILEAHSRLMVQSKGGVLSHNEVRVIVQYLAMTRADSFSASLAKKVKPTAVPKLTKAALLAVGKVDDPTSPPAKPKRAPTKAAKMKLFYRKAQGETLTSEEESILATL